MKKYNGGRFKDDGHIAWDSSGLFLIYTHKNGRVEELFVEEALNLGLKLPKRVEEESAKSSSHKPVVKNQISPCKDKYSGRFKSLLAVSNFQTDKERFLSLPRLKMQFDFQQAALGYQSCLLELVFVFEDYFWAFNSQKRLENMDAFSEIFARYDVKGNNLVLLRANVKAALGDALKEFKGWSTLLCIDPLSMDNVSSFSKDEINILSRDTVCEFTKLLMDAGFASWIKVYLKKKLSEANPTTRPKTVPWFINQWNKHERYHW